MVSSNLIDRISITSMNTSHESTNIRLKMFFTHVYMQTLHIDMIEKCYVFNASSLSLRRPKIQTTRQRVWSIVENETNLNTRLRKSMMPTELIEKLFIISLTYFSILFYWFVRSFQLNEVNSKRECMWWRL